MYLQKQKKQGSKLSNDDLFIYENASASTDEPKTTEIQIALDSAIKQLPEKQRIVFNMKYFDEMKYEQMSQILQTSVGALKASFHFAVKKIEEFLEEDHK